MPHQMPNLTTTSILKILTILILTIQPITSYNCKPFGIRLSFGTYVINQNSTQKLIIRFDTKDNCSKSYITIQQQKTSIRKIYCDFNKLMFANYTSYVHRCSIVNIHQGENIQYMVFGWSGNDSDPHIPYQSRPISYQFPYKYQQFRMVSLSDWSYLRQLRNMYKPLDQSFEYLLENDKKIKAIFINGDMAYDLQTNNGRNYQDFLNMISQVTIKWALIINQGNHQHRDNNSYILKTSFQTYGIVENRVVFLRLPWFNFILFDPYQILYNKEPQNISYNSYRKQLQKAYQTQDLTILASHYPFRCNGQPGDCQAKHQLMSNFFSAMFEINVPLYLGAHHHAYERHNPFKNDQTFIKTSRIQWKYDQKLENRLMVSIVEATAGNDINMVESYDSLQNFTAAVSYNITGYGVLSVGPGKLSYSHYTSNDATNPMDYVQIFLQRLKKLHLKTQ